MKLLQFALFNATDNCHFMLAHVLSFVSSLQYARPLALSAATLTFQSTPLGAITESIISFLYDLCRRISLVRGKDRQPQLTHRSCNSALLCNSFCHLITGLMSASEFFSVNFDYLGKPTEV